MGVMKLGKMTLSGLVKHPETIQYPSEKKLPAPGQKGQVKIDVTLCSLCGICQKRCPCGAISVDKAARTWSIDRFRCVQCGTCIRECPKHCLSMDPAYPAPSAKKHLDVFEVPEREKARSSEAPAAS